MAVITANGSTDSPNLRPMVNIGPLSINLLSRRVWVSGNPVAELSRKEFGLLAMLASSPTRVFTKAELYEKVWAIDPHVRHCTRTLDSHAARLRRKLREADPSVRGWVEAVWGVGYVLMRTAPDLHAQDTCPWCGQAAA